MGGNQRAEFSHAFNPRHQLVCQDMHWHILYIKPTAQTVAEQ